MGKNRLADLVQRYIRIQLKDLEGETLTADERLFLAKMDFSSETVGGELQNCILQYGLKRIRQIKPPPNILESNDDETRIAASTKEDSLYEEIQRAVQSGQTSVFFDVGGEKRKLFSINGEVVTPRYQEGYKFIIQRSGAAEQEVDTAGLINISIADVKRMRFSYDEKTRIIGVREIEA